MELGINTPEITAVSTTCIHVTMQVLTIFGDGPQCSLQDVILDNHI